ncbi:hypothetical protein J1N35_008545 [Gossypium stocksii]|uniref:CCHC-type domain-containing protein n=1 Tax=Gossypium stocksii TaxID=47602 RepID=A0A9D4AEL4_9ROSI|nr:hypothetical protein J1N35_008545 [Gossypium stocksii]
MFKDCSLLLPQFDNGVDRDSHSCEDRTTKKVRDSHSCEDRTTKKVRFKDGIDETSADMGSDSGNNGDFALLDDDVQTSIVNGVPVINFSNQVKEILFKEMELAVVIKLLGQSIGYNILHNRSLDYFWTISHRSALDQRFQLDATYPTVVLAWIRLPGLLGFLFRQKIVKAIGGLIGKVVKLDLQTDNRSRGRFTRLFMFLNLEKPLVSKVLVDGAVQRVEYKALPTVCFECGKYGHVKDFCPTVVEDRVSKHPIETVNFESISATNGNVEETRPDFGPWMLVER